MYRAVSSEEIAAYRQLVESLALRYVKYPEADYDDLVQEGLISVWVAKQRGNHPSAQVIQWNMLRWLAGQRRLRRGDAVAGMYLSLTPEWQAEFGSVLSGLDPWADNSVPGSQPPEKLQPTARTVDGYRPWYGCSVPPTAQVLGIPHPVQVWPDGTGYRGLDRPSPICGTLPPG